MSRANTRVVKIGDRVIGGGNPILIQSMTNTKTEDVEATVKQIQALTEAGCDIIRCAVPTMEAAKALSEDYPDHVVTQGVLSVDASQLYKGITPETAEMFARMLGTDKDEAGR